MVPFSIAGAAIKRRLQLLVLVPMLLAAVLLALIRYLYATALSPARAWHIAIGFDQLANVAANGSEDETISSRAHFARLQKRRWGCVLCGILDWIDTDHCRRSAGV